MHIFKYYLHIWTKNMHILFNKLTSISLKKLFLFLPVQRPTGGLQLLNLEACSSWTWRPIQKILKLGKIHHIRMIFSLITYPLSPKIKPILITHCYANVTKLSPPIVFGKANLFLIQNVHPYVLHNFFWGEMQFTQLILMRGK